MNLLRKRVYGATRKTKLVAFLVVLAVLSNWDTPAMVFLVLLASAYYILTLTKNGGLKCL